MRSANTYMAKPGEIRRQWYVVDAGDQPLGRVATQVATLLQGKHKPTYTPHIDTGDYVIVVNAAKVVLTGKKLDKKIYYHHTGWPRGLRAVLARKLLATRPERALERAVRGMLPKGALGRRMFGKLRVYAGSEHPHTAQMPVAWGRES